MAGWIRWLGSSLLACCCAGLLPGCGGNGPESPAPVAVQAKDAPAASAGFAGNGMWWNPAEPGSGFFFEEQGGTGVLTFFLFEASGKPAWYAAAGPVRLNDSGRTVFSGVLLRYSGGQPLASAQPKTPASRAVGSVQVTFEGDSAQVQLPQRAFTVQKFNPSARARPATASQPETGVYWNPAESGRGYTVEVNDGVATVGLFHYDAAGDPVWNLASGPLTPGGALQATLQAYDGGQLLAGLYQPARLLPPAGQLGAAFADPCAGSLALPGRDALAVQRFAFGSLAAGRECRARPRPGVFAANSLAASAVVGDIKVAVLSPTSVEADILQGQAMPGVPLSIVLVGEDAALAGKSYHAMVEDPDSLLSSVDKPEVIGGNGRTLASFLRPQNVGTLGERRGSFRIFLCIDPACSQQLSGSPMLQSYRVNVRGLQASKEAVLLNTLSGVQPLTQTLSITLPKGAFSFSARMKSGGATVLNDAPPLTQNFPAAYTTTVGITAGFAGTAATGLTTNALVVTARFQTAKGVDEWVKEIPVYRENFTAAQTSPVPLPSSEVQVRVPLGKLDSVPLDLKLSLGGASTAAAGAVQYIGTPGTEGHPMAQAWLSHQPSQSPPYRLGACNALDVAGGAGTCLPAGRYMARVPYTVAGSGQPVYQVVIMDVVAAP